MIVIADSGPIIHLSQIGKLSLLPSLFGEVVVPREVYNEVVIEGAGLPGSDELANAIWARIVDGPANDVHLRLLQQQLDPGELAAISLAVTSSDALLLIDDLAGRRAAKELNIQVIGSLGILLAAKNRGLIQSISPLLEELRQGGFWLSSAIVRQVLLKAGELV